MLLKPEISAGPMSLLARKQRLLPGMTLLRHLPTFVVYTSEIGVRVYSIVYAGKCCEIESALSPC